MTLTTVGSGSSGNCYVLQDENEALSAGIDSALNLINDKNPKKPTYISMHSAANGQIDDNCSMYWEEKKN